MDQRINADFSQRIALDTEAMPLAPSPQPGVERRMLDRIGGEVARATTIVRYAPGSVFPPHRHDRGEEFLVLEGVFSDEHGDYPVGTYIRNPPMSVHTPGSEPGCVIFVKLRQMSEAETTRVVIDTAAEASERLPLFADAAEEVAIERIAPEGEVSLGQDDAMTEVLVLSGDLQTGDVALARHGWLRLPPGSCETVRSTAGAAYWVKRSKPPRSS